MGMIKRFGHKGLEGIRAGRFNIGLNTSAIVYRLGRTIIDTGPPNQWKVIGPFLRERGIDRALLTHHHEDHSGNGAHILQEFRVPVIGPRESITPLSQGFPLCFYQKVLWGRPSPFQPEALTGDIETGEGTRLRPIHTPGHSKDMTCYLEPGRGWLFTGDLFIARRTKYLRRDEDLHQQILSLRHLKSFQFDTLFCSHRGIVKNGLEAIRDKYDFLLELCEQVKALNETGLLPAEIGVRLLGRGDPMRWVTGGQFSKMNLIRACLSVDDGILENGSEPMPLT